MCLKFACFGCCLRDDDDDDYGPVANTVPRGRQPWPPQHHHQGQVGFALVPQPQRGIIMAAAPPPASDVPQHAAYTYSVPAEGTFEAPGRDD